MRDRRGRKPHTLDNFSQSSATARQLGQPIECIEADRQPLRSVDWWPEFAALYGLADNLN
jgi:hypothetical protein